MAGLLGAKDVAGAAKLQVAHRNLEASAQVAVFLDRFQSLGGNGSDRPIRRQEKIAIRAMLPATDAAAKLVKFAEAKSIGTVDNDRVGVGDIQTALDDRRANQHVRLVADEFQHYFFQLSLAHLAMPDQDPRIGN